MFKQHYTFEIHVQKVVKNTTDILAVKSYDYNKKVLDNIIRQLAITDNDKFIDINKDKKKEEEEAKKAEETPEQKFSKGLEDKGLDTTGRNMAMQTYKKIERAIADSYSLLDDKKDRGLFYDYLITNLKLYFDKFEEEMSPMPQAEPTTPEYEAEKKRKSDEDTGTAQPLDM
jgi:hypothetical protein